MKTTLDLISERVDDIPLIYAELERMNVSALLNDHFPVHGNRKGLSFGGCSAIWLTHILSEADHRMNIVEDWAKLRLQSLKALSGEALCAEDLNDDRLSCILKAVSDDANWAEFESALTGNLLRVYELGSEIVRHDSTSASGYWQVSEDGYFQFGHSKDHRPDLPQVKVMLSSLDPLGLPIASEVVSGEKADDPLYIPAVKRVQKNVQKSGLLHVGDSKMSAIDTRAYIHSSGDFYLSPLSAVQVPASRLKLYLQPVWQKEQELIPIYNPGASCKAEKIAEGYEISLTHNVLVDGQMQQWQERQLVVRSFKHADASIKTLHKKLQKTQQKLLALNEVGQGKKVFSNCQQFQEKAEAIVKSAGLQDVFIIEYHENTQQKQVRAYARKPARIEEKKRASLSFCCDYLQYQEIIDRMGWRVYVSNAKKEDLPIDKAILAYRNEYLIEHGFKRLKGKPLSLTPTYLQRDDHTIGLIRLLSIALRVLVIIEYLVRTQLAKNQQSIQGLYAGNPKRATQKPTTEMILRAFKNITLTIILQQSQNIHHLTKLSELQIQILDLLGFSVNIYMRLCAKFEIPD